MLPVSGGLYPLYQFRSVRLIFIIASYSQYWEIDARSLLQKNKIKLLSVVMQIFSLSLGTSEFCKFIIFFYVCIVNIITCVM